jgi:hypothetical protein
VALRPGLAAVAALAAACAALGPRPVPEPILADLVARAERARGLTFPAPVQAELLPPRRVRAVFEREIDAAYGPDAFARAEALVRALGLLPAETRLREAVLDFQSGAVAGFYTPLRRRLYIVQRSRFARGLSPADTAVAVHELVHALQDAHFGIPHVLLGLDDHDDLAFALGALLEGDALWAAMREQSEDEGVPPPSASEVAAEMRVDDLEGPARDAPRLLRETFLLQYPLGYAIAESLAGRGGTAALDAAFRDPPLTSEEVLHPERYLDPAARAALPWLGLEAGAPGLERCAVGESNAFGELGLRVWAREHGASEVLAAAAGAGWDGDRAALLDCGAGEGFAWLVQFDAEADAVEFAELGAAPPGTRIERSGRRVLLSLRLEEPVRRAALAVPERRFDDLGAYLAARPGVLERADQRQGNTMPRSAARSFWKRLPAPRLTSAWLKRVTFDPSVPSVR